MTEDLMTVGVENELATTPADEILAEKRIRHIDTFVRQNPDALHITSGANRIITKEK